MTSFHDVSLLKFCRVSFFSINIFPYLNIIDLITNNKSCFLLQRLRIFGLFCFRINFEILNIVHSSFCTFPWLQYLLILRLESAWNYFFKCHFLIGRNVYFLACDSVVFMRNSSNKTMIVLISANTEFYRIWSPFWLDGGFKFYMIVGIQEADGMNYWVGGGTEISDANTRPVYSVPGRHWPSGCPTVAVKLSGESFRVKSRLRVSDYSGWPPTNDGLCSFNDVISVVEVT